MRTSRIFAAIALPIGVIIGTATLASSGTSTTAPAPRCEVNPSSSVPGDGLLVRGQGWEPRTTVTVTFDSGESGGLTNATSGTDTTATTDDHGSGGHGSDDNTSTTLTDDRNVSSDSTTSNEISIDVGARGRFHDDITIPDDASRGTHSINVAGADADGVDAHCARIVRVSEDTSNPTQKSSGTTLPSTPSSSDDTRTSTSSSSSTSTSSP